MTIVKTFNFSDDGVNVIRYLPGSNQPMSEAAAKFGVKVGAVKSRPSFLNWVSGKKDDRPQND